MADAELQIPVVSNYKQTRKWQKDYQKMRASELPHGEHWAEVLLPDAMIKPYVDVDIRKPTPDQTVEAVREVWEPALRKAFPDCVLAIAQRPGDKLSLHYVVHGYKCKANEARRVMAQFQELPGFDGNAYIKDGARVWTMVNMCKPDETAIMEIIEGEDHQHLLHYSYSRP